MAAAGRHGWSLTGGVVGLFPLDLGERSAVSMGVWVDPGAPAIAELPAGRVAGTVHVGSYAELPLAYAALFAWVHGRGHEPVAPVIQTYLTNPEEAAPHELVTRLAVGVAD